MTPISGRYLANWLLSAGAALAINPLAWAAEGVTARLIESTISASVAMYTLLPARTASTPRAIAGWLLPVPGEADTYCP